MNLSSFGRRLLAAANGTVAGTIMGLGTAAFKNTGTSGNAVPLLDGVNTWSGIQAFSANPSVTGGAISFPATQVPSAGANDLDDYEEGTFTPAFSATGATFSYASQVGVYTKIGRVVYFWVTITLNTSGNTLTANVLSVTGMPFTAGATNGQGIFPVRWTASTATYINMYVRVPSNTATLAVEGQPVAATTNVATVNSDAALHATNGSTFRVAGFYIV